MQGRWRRVDTAGLVAWALATLAVRLGFAAEGTYSVDGALLSLGVSSFDFSDYRPHAPYYPLTIAAAKLLAPLAGPTHALTALAAIASAALTGFGFLLAHRLGDRVTAHGAAALLVASPLLLLNGAVPLSYSLEGAAGAAVAWTALRARDSPGLRWSILLGLGGAVAVGLRPSGLLLVAPVMLWGTRSWTRLLTVAGSGVAGLLAWLPATVVAGGSWRDFGDGIALQSGVFILSNPVWSGGRQAVAEHAQWLAWHLRIEGPFLVAVALLAVTAGFTLRGSASSRARGFLLAWGLPSAAFYVLVYSGWPVYPSGYLVGALACGLIASALLLRDITRAVLRPDVARPAKALAAFAVVGALALPAAWPLEWSDSTASIRAADEWERSLVGLEEVFPAQTTALLALDAAAWTYRHHPAHWAWYVQAVPGPTGALRLQVQENQFGDLDKGVVTNALDGPDDAEHRIPDWVQRIVVVEGQPGYDRVPLLRPDVVVQHAVLPGGGTVRVVDVVPGTAVEALLADWGQELGKPYPGFPPPG